MSERRFPIQRGGTVEWAVAERAYATYAKRFGTEQSLERLAERGGFGIVEFSMLYRGLSPELARNWNCERSVELVLSVVRELGDGWRP